MSEPGALNNELSIYDAEFYADQINGSIRSASIIAPDILSLFPNISSVIDMGCGAGTWLSEFKRLGVNDVSGFDGGNAPADCLLIEKSEYHKADFTKEFSKQHHADLAISLEVAEHLDSRFAKTFVSNLCSASDLIVFSAAIPGQGGTHHVNERWPSYWVDLFSAENYVFFDVLRSQHWYDSRVEWWYRQNIFMVVNRERQDLMDVLAKRVESQQPIFDLVHPDLFLRSLNQAKTHAEESARLAAEIESLLNSNSWKLMSTPRAILAFIKRFSLRR